MESGCETWLSPHSVPFPPSPSITQTHHSPYPLLSLPAIPSKVTEFEEAWNVLLEQPTP